MFGHRDEILPIWPLLSESPVLQRFGWSSLAHQAFETNRALISPALLTESSDTAVTCPNCVDPYARLDGLLVLHLRRGDFLEHCENLCHWGADFAAFNSFPEFVDPWIKPEGPEGVRMSVYLRRCLPTAQQIVTKVEEVRASMAGKDLRNIYIMTNGDRAWLAGLKAALHSAHAWDHIATTRDVVLTWEEKFVSQTMDMLIGQRAQVFVGNGVSVCSYKLCCVSH
jgi:hypothetical protein